MSEVVSHSSVVADGVVDQIMNNFQVELSTKQVIKKMPENIHENMKQVTAQMIFTNHLPKPNHRRQWPMIEDPMPNYRRKQSKLIGKMRLVGKQDLQFQQTSSTFNARYTPASRYSSASELQNKRHVQINSISNSRENKVIELRPQQQTAKSFRSVIQLESQITQLRRAYLKNLRQLEKNKSTSKQQLITERKRIPKQFTFDYNCQLLQTRMDMKAGLAKSPLKSKSVNNCKITNKAKSPSLLIDDQSHLQEQLLRNPTGSPEKQKRVYNNSSRRQVSHFPYISLVQKSKLYQNQNILYGPQAKSQQASTSYEWKLKSNFVPYFQHKQQEPSKQLITQTEQAVFPTTFNRESIKSNNGNILKNPRFFKKSHNDTKESSKQLSVEYNPVNVTRNHPIDQYYKIRAVDV